MIAKPVLFDVESRSRADLRVIGGRAYWRHPSSEILVVVAYDTADGSVHVWAPGQPWPFGADRVLAAHNAHGFDRFALKRYGIACAGWIDTSQLARKAGMPGALDAIGTRWCGVPKDKDASRFTVSLSRVRRPTGKEIRDALSVVCPKCHAAPGATCAKKDGTPSTHCHKERRMIAPVICDANAIPPETWRAMPASEKRARGVQPVLDADAMDRVTRYCALDVEIMARAWPRLEEWIDVDADCENVDRVINDRGVLFDVALAQRLLAEDARIGSETIASVAAKMNMSPDDVRNAARSPSRFCAITGAPNAQAATVEAIDHPLARARMALASIAAGKLRAGLTRVHADGRLRDAARYYGAHTGRWSGQGMQLQNMPRPAKHFENLPADTTYPHTISAKGERVIDVDAYANEVLRGRPCDADDVALLLRATICAAPGHVFVVRDYKSVEARATAWVAGDAAALEVFRSGRDPYKVAASAIFGVAYDDVEKWQRQVGKVAELALGYQGGPGAFESLARVYRIDPAIMNALDLPSLVARWRGLHVAIKSLWYACQRAFHAAVIGTPTSVSVLEYAPGDRGEVACFLPSGRPIVYQEASADAEGLVFTGTKGREHTYGGKLVENAIQGLCRDLLAEALVRAEDAGLRPVLHVHDEIVCEVPRSRAAEAEALLHKIMTSPPAWAQTFPLDADGWIGERYRK